MKILRAITGNAGIRADVNKRLLKEIRNQEKAIKFWLKLLFFETDDLAKDISPQRNLFDSFRADIRRYLRRWKWLSEWIAERSISQVESTTFASLKQAFIAAGLTVKYQPERRLNNVTQSLIAESVSSIFQLGQNYLSAIEKAVTNAIVKGHDYKGLTETIRVLTGKTKHKSYLLARDQIDYATQVIQREHDKNLGITEGIWVHLPGQHTSRKTHMEMDGKRFKLDEGLFDSDVGRYVKTGELMYCRCTYRRIIPEFGDT